MEGKKKFETYQMLPRVYGTSPAYRTVVSAPSRYAIGAFLTASKREKLQMLKEWLDYYSKRFREGDPTVQRISDCLFYSPEDLYEALREPIVKEKGSQKLWKVTEPIVDGRLEHNVLTGRVKSRRRGGRKNVLKEWFVVVNSPYFDRDNERGCQCDDFLWDKTKRAVVVCVHQGGLEYRANLEFPGKEEGLIEFIEPQDIPYLPFILDSTTIADVAIQHYFLKARYYDIDKEMLNNPSIYDPLHLESIEKGNRVFEVIPQISNRKMAIPEGDAKALEFVWKREEEVLRRGEFKRVGSASLEFKGTEWEIVCPTYEKNGRVVRFLFSDRHPPLLVYREVSAQDPVEVFYKLENTNPFNMLFKEQQLVDDRTRRRTKTKIIIPHSPKLVEELPELQEIRRPIIGNFKRQYAELIRQHYQGDSGQLIRELGLGLF